MNGDQIAAAVREHAEAILKASGSSLRNYELNGSRGRILTAVLDCWAAAYRAGADHAAAIKDKAA